MVTEDYVSFETAKLLKEKGFGESCTHVYNIETGRNLEADFYTSRYVYNSWLDKNESRLIVAPTLQMAMKWLREIHNIHIVIKSVIRTYGNTEYYYELYGTKNKSLCIVCDIYKEESWNRSEEATEAAIKYCLKNLISV